MIDVKFLGIYEYCKNQLIMEKKAIKKQPNEYREGIARKEVYIPHENLKKLKIKAATANISLKAYIENVLIADSEK